MTQAEGHQGVRSHGGDFQEHVNIEQVGGQHQAVHAGDHQQQQGVIIGLGSVVFHVVDGIQGDGQADQRDGEQHEQAEAVDQQADIERRAEPERLLDDAALGDQRLGVYDRKDHEKEHGRVRQQVGQETFGNLAQQGQQAGQHQRYDNENEDHCSSLT